MSENVTIDKKGRLLLPKKVRAAAEINPPTQAVIVVRGPGRIELVAVDLDMKKAKGIASKKLASWKEEDHEADKIAAELAIKEEQR